MIFPSFRGQSSVFARTMLRQPAAMPWQCLIWEFRWEFDGNFHGNLWILADFYGISTGFLWNFCGFHGISMGFLWKFHGISGLDGFLVGHVCGVRWESSESYGISMVFLWNWWDLVDGYYGFYGICMAFRWILWWNCGGLMRIQDQLENHADALEIMEDTSFLFTCRKRVSSFFGVTPIIKSNAFRGLNSWFLQPLGISILHRACSLSRKSCQGKP